MFDYQIKRGPRPDMNNAFPKKVLNHLIKNDVPLRDNWRDTFWRYLGAM